MGQYQQLACPRCALESMQWPLVLLLLLAAVSASLAPPRRAEPTAEYHTTINQQQPWAYRPNSYTVTGSGSGPTECGADAPESCSPANWGSIYPLCDQGNQSPIDIAAQIQPSESLKQLEFASEMEPCASAILYQNDHSVEVVLPDQCLPDTAGTTPTQGTSLRWQGTTYFLDQYHFHTPSEHTIDGASSSAEVHQVFQNADDEDVKYLVVAVFLQVGPDEPDNQFIGRIWDLGFNTTQIQYDLSGPSFDPVSGDLFDPAGGYCHYSGSFTTPPCTSNVEWVLMKDSVGISESQLSKLRHWSNSTEYSQAILDGPLTNRPVQDLQGRIINMFDPSSSDGHVTQVRARNEGVGVVVGLVLFVISMGLTWYGYMKVWPLPGAHGEEGAGL